MGREGDGERGQKSSAAYPLRPRRASGTSPAGAGEEGNKSPAAGLDEAGFVGEGGFPAVRSVRLRGVKETRRSL